MVILDSWALVGLSESGKATGQFKLELPMFDDEVSRSTWTYTTSRIVVNGKPKPEWLIRIRAVQYQAEVLDWNHN